MRTVVVALAAAAIAASASSGFAQNIQKHETRQEERIENGVNSGRLTDKEAGRLQNQQEIIHKEREQALEDGKISKRERRDIRHDQKRANKEIHHKKHNARKDHDK
jgi:hypothetical protein